MLVFVRAVGNRWRTSATHLRLSRGRMTDEMCQKCANMISVSHCTQPKISQTCLFKFGLISDIQYADCDNGTDYSKTCVRYYRNSYIQLLSAATSWGALLPAPSAVSATAAAAAANRTDCCRAGVDFVLQLGDLVDGRSRRLGAGATDAAFSKLLAVFEALPAGVVTHHCIGNHELYNVSHDVAVRRLWPTLGGCGSVSPAALVGEDYCEAVAAGYYSFVPHPGFRFVKVDHYDVAAIGHPPDSANYVQALEYLSVNKNAVKLDSDGLEGASKRFVAFNGAIGAEQLAWLEKTLSEADRSQEKVVIFGHQPVLASHADPRSLLWNHDAVCDMIARHSCVVMHISGHEHVYWSARDARGVHHLSLPGVVETAPGSAAHGTCRMLRDGLLLDGAGGLPSGWYAFATLPSSASSSSAWSSLHCAGQRQQQQQQQASVSIVA